MPLAVQAEDCFYREGREGFVAVEVPNGFAILAGLDGNFDGKNVAAGQIIDQCTSEQGDVTRYSHCDGGWEGVLFFGGLSADDPYGDEIMVLQNSLWYRECNAPKDGGI